MAMNDAEKRLEAMQREFPEHKYLFDVLDEIYLQLGHIVNKIDNLLTAQANKEKESRDAYMREAIQANEDAEKGE